MTPHSTSGYHLADPGYWNFKALAACCAIGLGLQMAFLPCLCALGKVQMELAPSLDLLVPIRASIAYLTRPKGSGWVLYAVLVLNSPIWIMLAVSLLTGHS